MTVLSLLRGITPRTGQNFSLIFKAATVPVVRHVELSIVRHSGHKTPGEPGSLTNNYVDFGPKFVVVASRYNWQYYKDVLQFYIMLGVIPLTLLVFLVNIYIGPATLTEIPEGYVPEQHEYYKHPITRWLVKNYFRNPQKVYEMNMFYLFQYNEQIEMKALEDRAKRLMQQRGDYAGLFFAKPLAGKYLRRLIHQEQETREIVGDRSD